MFSSLPMFCVGVGVKESPGFKISFSSWENGTFDKFKIFVDCGCVIGASCDSRFLVMGFNWKIWSLVVGFPTYLNKLLILFEPCSSECVSFNLSKCLFQLFAVLVSSSLTLLLHFDRIGFLSLLGRIRVSTDWWMFLLFYHNQLVWLVSVFGVPHLSHHLEH